jgi:hypothetical protein
MPNATVIRQDGFPSRSPGSQRKPTRPVSLEDPAFHNRFRRLSSAAMPLVLLAGSLACTVPVQPARMGPCGPRPTQQQAEADARSFCPRALEFPYLAKVQDVRIVGPEKIYTGIVRGISCSYGWAIAFEVSGRQDTGDYSGFRAVTVVASPGGKIHWEPKYGPGSD